MHLCAKHVFSLQMKFGVHVDTQSPATILRSSRFGNPIGKHILVSGAEIPFELSGWEM